MEKSEFRDMDHFISQDELLKYIESYAFEKTYLIKYDPEKKRKRKFEYWNVPCSFDIETSSFRTASGEKMATMYLWGFNFNGRSTYGRTWTEWIQLITSISEMLNCSQINLIVWVHNLPYEMGFMNRYFEFVSSFCMADHKMVRGLTTLGIEFRDSLVESGKRLELLAEEIKENPVEKLVGSLNYRMIRHSGSPVTEEELRYQLNDVRVVANYIYEKGKKRYWKIPGILMTKTSYVRERYRKNSIDHPDRNTATHYRGWMKELTLNIEEYRVLELAFRGGHTHANALWVGDILPDVHSYDETSAYPLQFLKLFPMGKGVHFENPTPEQIESFLQYYCCVFRLEVWNLRRKQNVYDDPLSKSKCIELEKPRLNNGRVRESAHVVTYLTEVDYRTYKKFYDWDSECISDLWRYERGFLPKPIIETMLDLYANKTSLKGVDDMEELYMLSKGDLNSSYGMMVTKIIQDLIVFTEKHEYKLENEAPEKMLHRYNQSRKRFLFFPWGVYITAYNREVILDAILEAGRDFVYSDTDSIKLINEEKHRAYFERYNESLPELLRPCMEFHGIPMEKLMPKTKKGIPKLLGAFDHEHDGKPYEAFKTLGAKRYMTYDHGEIEITVAGLGKKEGREWILEHGDSPEEWFDYFSEEMAVPAERTGKLTHTYIDHPMETVLEDDYGISQVVHEESCIHLEPAPFNLDISKDFMQFLLGYEESYGIYGND